MTNAYLEITLRITPAHRAKAGAVYTPYKQPFLPMIPDAQSKELLLRDEDVQVLHGFDSRAHSEQYLTSSLFSQDVVGALTPSLAADPEIRIYGVQ